MTRVYYKDAHGAIVVFDCTRPNTCDGALRWKADLDSKITLANGTPLPAVLVANKVHLLPKKQYLSADKVEKDLRDRGITPSGKNKSRYPPQPGQVIRQKLPNGYYSLGVTTATIKGSSNHQGNLVYYFTCERQYQFLVVITTFHAQLCQRLQIPTFDFSTAFCFIASNMQISNGNPSQREHQYTFRLTSTTTLQMKCWKDIENVAASTVL